MFSFLLLDSQSQSSSSTPTFNQLTKRSLRFGDVILLQLWISSQRDQLHNSLIPLLSQARSLWVEQKQSLPESNTAAPLSWLRCASLFSQSYTVHARTHTHTLACITPRHKQWTLQVVSHQRKVCFFFCCADVPKGEHCKSSPSSPSQHGLGNLRTYSIWFGTVHAILQRTDHNQVALWVM